MKIYLDQNHLSHLFYSDIGDPRGNEYKEILGKVLNSIDNGKAIYPISCSHVLETAKFTLKEELSKFLFKISKGYAMLPFWEVVNYEINNAITKRMGMTDKIIDLNEIVIQKKGILHSFGSKSYVDSQMINENVYIECINLITDEQIAQMKSDDLGYASFFNKEREKIKDLEPKVAFKVIIVDVYDYLLPLMGKMFKELGVDIVKFTDKYLSNEKEIMNFFKEITTMLVFASLLLKRDLYKAEVHPNDLVDMGFLMTAISNCDIVVSEKYWESVYRESKLNKQYDTVVLNDVRELDKYI